MVYIREVGNLGPAMKIPYLSPTPTPSELAQSAKHPKLTVRIYDFITSVERPRFSWLVENHGYEIE